MPNQLTPAMRTCWPFWSRIALPLVCQYPAPAACAPRVTESDAISASAATAAAVRGRRALRSVRVVR